MTDSAHAKTNESEAPTGAMGQRLLASGETVAMRLWRERPGESKSPRSRPYEIVGYVVSGTAVLEVGGERTQLGAGDSWVVPKGAEHRYEILSEFTAVEATSPPARDA